MSLTEFPEIADHVRSLRRQNRVLTFCVGVLLVGYIVLAAGWIAKAMWDAPETAEESSAHGKGE